MSCYLTVSAGLPGVNLNHWLSDSQSLPNPDSISPIAAHWLTACCPPPHSCQSAQQPINTQPTAQLPITVPQPTAQLPGLDCTSVAAKLLTFNLKHTFVVSCTNSDQLFYAHTVSAMRFACSSRTMVPDSSVSYRSNSFVTICSI